MDVKKKEKKKKTSGKMARMRRTRDGLSKCACVGAALRVPRQDSMSCLFVSIDQAIKGATEGSILVLEAKRALRHKARRGRGKWGVLLWGLLSPAARRLPDEEAQRLLPNVEAAYFVSAQWENARNCFIEAGFILLSAVV